MSFCKDCVRGFKHEGTPEGKVVKLGGVDSYVAVPTVDYPKDRVLLVLTDIFGIGLVNNKLLADDYARNGFYTVVPDYLNGDWCPPNALSGDSGFDLMAWFGSHGQEQTRPPLDKVIAALKEQGFTTFGVSGHCFGARYAFDLAYDGVVKAVSISHPSLLQVPDDFEKYKANVKAPLLINSCETDPQFPAPSQAEADRILGNGQFAPGYKREYWEGCTHGFTVRGDLSDPKVKAGKEGAFQATHAWLTKYL